MASAALSEWRTVRADRLAKLLGAHEAVGGTRAGRRWATEELNHALVLRLASEFQGFCRELHDDAVTVLVAAVARGDSALERALAIPYRSVRMLDRGNASSRALGNDFSLLGLDLWPDLHARYPRTAEGWRRKLDLLNKARNGIVHDDTGKRLEVRAAGWPSTLASVRRWRAALDGLAQAMDTVISEYLANLLKVKPW